MKKKPKLTIEEIFCGMPMLLSYFQKQKKLIEKFDGQNTATPYLTRLKTRLDALLEVVYSLNVIDLEILYYMKNIRSIDILYAANCLKKLAEAELNFKNLIGDEKYARVLKVLAEDLET